MAKQVFTSLEKKFETPTMICEVNSSDEIFITLKSSQVVIRVSDFYESIRITPANGVMTPTAINGLGGVRVSLKEDL